MVNQEKQLTPIQIIGTQRSGSNLLRLILNQSPLISAHHPPHILTVFYPIIHKYGDLKLDANFIKLINDVCRLIETNPVKWDINLNRKTIFSYCKQRTLIEIFKVVYEEMAKKDKALFWCCKSMANVNYYKAIEDNGMKPYYIHLVRDGRDVASSFKNILVGEKHAYQLANVWKNNLIKAKEVLQNVGSKRYLTIRYETLTQQPMTVLEQLNDFLDLNLDALSLNYFNSHESKNTAEAGFMWSNLTRPIISNNTRKFINELGYNEIEIFERVSGNVLQEYNYTLFTTPSKKPFTPNEINNFEQINLNLKNKALDSPHLQIDKKNRTERQKLLIELNS